jgi:5-carboxymethyl-2-hydroxymuconate isomerase
MRGLLGEIHRVALDTGVFPLGGIRVRAAKRDLYIVADGDPENCFVHITLLIGVGRTPETKKVACDQIFEAVKAYLVEPFERVPLAISLTLNELNPDLTYRHNNLHQRLKKPDA